MTNPCVDDFESRLKRLVKVMTNAHSSNSWRAPIELAVAVSVFAVAAALTLSWFGGVGDTWIVLGTIVGASIVGWRQPEARLRGRLVPIKVLTGTRRHSA
jgi:hypothetical protein